MRSYTLQGISRTSSTNPSKIMKQMDANAALYSTSHCKNLTVNNNITIYITNIVTVE